ncbi:MAG: MaoC/PaaZ C-terminal domain-containing protein [Candidatus Bathyarchaeia archaeon]
MSIIPTDIPYLPRETPKKCWEDFNVGDKTETFGITITDAHLVLWAGLTGDFFPLHICEEYAKRTIFKGRIAHGLLTFALSAGLVWMSGIFEDSVMALLSVRDVRFLVPVKIGDTIRVEVEVLEKKETSKPDRGIITFRYTVKNQKDEAVLIANMIFMMHRRQK